MEPLSLKGQLGGGGGLNGSSGTVPTGQEVLGRGWAGLELTDGAEELGALPTWPWPGERQLPLPALVAAGHQPFHFGHLLGGLPLLGMRRTLALSQLLLHLLG